MATKSDFRKRLLDHAEESAAEELETSLRLDGLDAAMRERGDEWSEQFDVREPERAT